MADQEITELKKTVEALTEQIKALQSGPPINDDLGGSTIPADPPTENQMFSINMERRDEFGDGIEATTKARLQNYEEARRLAFTYIVREYHNMQGCKFGAHSKLIPVEDVDNKVVNLSWFSGMPIKKITIRGQEFYKIRILISDIFVKKYLQLTIPTSEGKARYESILDKGVNIIGVNEKNLPIPPLYASQYKKQASNIQQAGDVMFKENE